LLAAADSAAAQPVWAALNRPAALYADQINGPLAQVNISGFSPIGVNTERFPQTQAQNTFYLSNNISRYHSVHSFSAGVSTQRLQLNDSIESGVRPLAVYSGLRVSADANLPQQVCTPFGCSTVPAPQPAAPSVFSGETMAAAGAPTGLFQTLNFDGNYSDPVRAWEISAYGQYSYHPIAELEMNFALRLGFNLLPGQLSTRTLLAYDYAALTSEANGVAANANCDARCKGLVSGLEAAFPSDFPRTFGRDRVANDGRFVLHGLPAKNDRTSYAADSGSIEVRSR
jgi:hypothetical protein